MPVGKRKHEENPGHPASEVKWTQGHPCKAPVEKATANTASAPSPAPTSSVEPKEEKEKIKVIHVTRPLTLAR